MNKYAKIYLGALKTANPSRGVIAAVFPGFNKVLDMVKDYQAERRAAKAPVIQSRPTINLPKEIPQVNTQEVLKNIPKPPKIEFK
jgi:hypothetical protein